jgi:hypothetical protein
VSRLTTVVCALSAIVTIVDYFTARAFFSGWLARQASYGPEGWRISASLNVLLIAGGAALVWLFTSPETPPADAEARQRLFRLRANVVACGLAVWFFLGPSVGGVPLPPPETAATQPADWPAAPRRPALTLDPSAESTRPSRPAPPHGGGGGGGMANDAPWPPRAAGGQVSEPWRPGDGLKSLGKLFDGWIAPHDAPPPRLGEQGTNLQTAGSTEAGR